MASGNISFAGKFELAHAAALAPHAKQVTDWLD
jgi:hypothetical protein